MLPCIRSPTSKKDPVRSFRDEATLSKRFLGFAANEDLTNNSAVAAGAATVAAAAAGAAVACLADNHKQQWQQI